MKQLLDINEINTEAFVLLAPKPVSDITLVVVPGVYCHFFNNCMHCRFLIISAGNPGAVEFYVEFITELFHLLDQKYSVIGGPTLTLRFFFIPIY
jgi:hypothetical protein